MSNGYKNFYAFRLVAALMTLVMLFTSVSFHAYAARNFQAEIDAYEAKIKAANSKKSDQEKTAEELQNDITLLQEQVDVYQEKIDSLNAEINEKNAQIAQFESEITALENEINETNAKIDETNKQIDDTYEIIKDRMRASYMAGETSTLEIILGSMNYEDFLTRLELVSAVTKHDREIITGLENDIAKLNELVEAATEKKTQQEEKKAAVVSEKAAIVEKRSDVQSSKNAVVSKQSNMESKVNQINSLIEKLEENTVEYRAAIVAIQKAEEEYNRQQNAKLSTGSGVIQSTEVIGNYTVSSKGLICPLQYSNVRISSGWGEYAGHKGTDLITSGATGNTYGKEIRAAASGTVVFAGSGSGSSWSYGNFVTIDHGNGVSTRYAHCSSVAVSSGQKVAQGQVIAYVGNTGNVYPRPSASNPHAGAHLHFEVILNGDRVNAAPWLPAIQHA